MEELHPDDRKLPQLDIVQVQKRIPRREFIAVLREYDNKTAPPCSERWSYNFLLNRLAADGAFDAQAITSDPRFGIVTRVASGQRVFVQTTETLDEET